MRNVLKIILIIFGSRIEQKDNRKGRFKNDFMVFGFINGLDCFVLNSYEIYEVSYNGSGEFQIEFVLFKVCV